MDQFDCLCIRLRRASRALTRLYDEALSETGLNIAQLGLLFSVWQAQPIAIKALAKKNQLDPSTLGRNLGVLERRKLLTLSAGEDGRTRIVALTETGMGLLMRAAPLWESAQNQARERLTADGERTLRALLALLEGDEPDLVAGSRESPKEGS